MPKENIYNELYERAKNGELFTNLMPLVLSKENILLAYRNIKNNTGSNTAGTDKLTIADIGKLSPEEVTAIRHKKRLPPKTRQTEGHSKAQRKHAPARYPLHLGQTDSAMFQASLRADLRSPFQQAQPRLQTEPLCRKCHCGSRNANATRSPALRYRI